MGTKGAIGIQEMQATNSDALVKNAKSASVVENGMVVDALTYSSVSGEGEVKVVTFSTTATGFYLVSDPSPVLTDSKYLGINPDPTDQSFAIGKIFSIKKVKKGDVVGLTGTCFTNAVTVGDFVNKTATGKLTFAATSGSATIGKRFKTVQLPLSQGNPSNTSIDQYVIEFTAE